MDTFDIDKLLDELELNEDNKTTATTPSAEPSKPDQLCEQPQLKFSNSFNVETTKNTTSSSSSFKNVFSSLNDYVNAGIETTTKTESNNDSEANLNNGHGSKYFDKQPESDEEKSCLLNDDREHGDVSDDSGSGGRRLPIEDRRPDFNSSSSASSSPTSGHSTSSIPSSTEIEYENQTFDNNTHSFSEFSEKPPPLAEVPELDSTALELERPTHTDIPPSNISDTFSTETINLEEISSLSSIVEITSNYNNMKVGSTMDENESLRPAGQYMAVNPIDSKDLNPNEHQPDNAANKRQVVGFESTMDDVSDTELESYLQDLEYEVSERQDIALKSTECENVITKLEMTATETNRSVDVVEEDDQLSQASTVEVNDSKLHEVEVPQLPDLDNNPDVEQQPPVLEEAACSSIKQVNVLKNEVEAIDQQSELVVAQESQEQKVSSSDEALEKEVSENEDEVNANNPVTEEEETSTKQPMLQRPNSLDLNTSNNASDANQPQSSPGHTPPSTAHPPPMDSETTSSSEDFSASIAIPEEANEGSGGRTLESNQETYGGLTTTQLGKIPPYWVPDNITRNCMQCNVKFTMLRRRHHCRACGQLLCSACCCRKTKLEYMGDTEERICVQCDVILSDERQKLTPGENNSGDSPNEQTEANNGRQPNPNNPMEYCSVIPPHQQIANASQTPISVMVPVGVLKREGAPRSGRKDKNVIFSDGIRPGCDLTDLDNNWSGDTKPNTSLVSTRKSLSRRAQTPPGNTSNQPFKSNIQLPLVDETNNSYIPKKDNELPPIYTQTKTDFKYTDVENGPELLERLKTDTLKFAIQRNFYVYVKIIQLSCCINKTVINFTTEGMHHVGQDEIIVLLEMNDSTFLPKDIFLHFNEIYTDADKGTIVNELGFTTPKMANFLGSKEHGGFLYIRQTFQCLQSIHLPEPPYLIGILIHRWEVPWARLFPIRLMLRLGALYRYYPSPLVSVRERDSVYVEIGQTIINVLADFRTYSFTISTIRGMVIHMEDRKTSVLIPRNRYDQVVKTLNNSSDHILAFGANFSRSADGHLVCVQNTESDSLNYTTQAINIQGQPRKVTGASFLVLNGALKSTSGFSAKCTIVEDGLMVQVLPNKMTEIRESLKNIKDVEIICGPVNADEQQTEHVSIKWVENDVNFNIGILSPIDKKPMDGVPCIRVHRGLDFSNTNHMIRWTEVYILKSDDESAQGRDPVDMTKLSEQIARSTCLALLSFLDLLATNGLRKIGLRVTLDPENVCYEAGSKYEKLAPLYMNALDNELVMTLHRHTTNSQTDTSIMLELIFYILDK